MRRRTNAPIDIRQARGAFSRQGAVMLSFVTLLLLGSSLLPPGFPLRLAITIPYVLLAPGYALLYALHPGLGGLSFLERLGLSACLSMPLISGVGMLLNVTPHGITVQSASLVISAIVLIMAFAGTLRRSSIPLANGPDRTEASWIATARGVFSQSRVLTLVLALPLVGFAASIWCSIGVDPPIETFTEFYIMGPTGRLGDVPREVVAGEPVDLTLGVVNHEVAQVRYRIIVVGKDLRQDYMSPTLRHLQSWDLPISLVFGGPSADGRVSFLLYREGETDPYRFLSLNILVEERADG